MLEPSKLVAGSFQGIGAFSGGEFRYSTPWDISADGKVVVGESQSAQGLEAFRWTAATGLIGLGGLGGEPFVSAAFGVSADGSVIVGVSASPLSETDRGEAFRWTEAEGMVALGDLPGGEFSSAAVGVTADGAIVTGGSTSFLSPTLAEAFLWSQPTNLVGLGVIPGHPNPATVPSRISADGTVVVGWAQTLNGREAFRWSQSDGLVAMGDLPGGMFDSYATGVSADGSVIVGVALNPGVTAFRWTASTGMIDLGNPPGGYLSEAFAITPDGRTVVGNAGVDGSFVPMIWDEAHGMRNLIEVFVELGLGPSIAGWDLEEARAVSADGLTVVGYGFNPAGEREGWIADLRPASVVEVPTASTAALSILASLIVGAALLTMRLR